MREVNLAGVDLNLVPALEALLRRRSVTRAADDVGLSQPAMSRALARLRDLLGDPLLVRTRAGYALTPRAEALRPGLAGATAGLRGLFQPHSFDPAAARRTVRLAAADVQTVLILPGVMARLAAEAPGLDLVAESYGPDTLARLEGGALDLAFALASTSLPPGMLSEPAGQDRLALVTRAGHPMAGGRWTPADYGRHGHVGVALLGDGRSEIDAALAAHGVTRRLALVTPHFTAALAAVAAGDLVTTVSAALARRLAPALGLALHEPPLPDAALPNTLVFSPVRAADPLLAWLRGIIREAAERAFAAEA